MALNVNALIRDYKSAGIYTIEIDNSQRTIEESDSLRLLVGFAPKGPFNRPVYLENDNDRQRIYGDIDEKLEHKGCYFNRFAQTMLRETPIFALNLLHVDESANTPDKVNFASMSLNAPLPNPKMVKSAGATYGEFDYLKDDLDKIIYGTVVDDVIPYVGATPFASLYDRSKFWVPAKDNLLLAAAEGLNTGDVNSFEHTNFLNFGNIGTEEFSILVFKPENLKGFDITVAEWYGGKENIPYGWLRPYDYISDYFLQVICVKGNWTNYANLSTDPIWHGYFDKYGIIKERINNFLASDGVDLLGSWTGIIIPNFVDKQGVNQNIIEKINKQCETTGLMASFNEDAAVALNFDYNGADTLTGETGEENGCWFIDADENGQMETANGEMAANQKFLVDMVGHNFKSSYLDTSEDYLVKVSESMYDTSNNLLLISTNEPKLSFAFDIINYNMIIDGDTQYAQQRAINFRNQVYETVADLLDDYMLDSSTNSDANSIAGGSSAQGSVVTVNGKISSSVESTETNSNLNLFGAPAKKGLFGAINPNGYAGTIAVKVNLSSLLYGEPNVIYGDADNSNSLNVEDINLLTNAKLAYEKTYTDASTEDAIWENKISGNTKKSLGNKKHNADELVSLINLKINEILGLSDITYVIDAKDEQNEGCLTTYSKYTWDSGIIEYVFKKKFDNEIASQVYYKVYVKEVEGEYYYTFNRIVAEEYSIDPTKGVTYYPMDNEYGYIIITPPIGGGTADRFVWVKIAHGEEADTIATLDRVTDPEAELKLNWGVELDFNFDGVVDQTEVDFAINVILNKVTPDEYQIRLLNDYNEKHNLSLRWDVDLVNEIINIINSAKRKSDGSRTIWSTTKVLIDDSLVDKIIEDDELHSTYTLLDKDTWNSYSDAAAAEHGIVLNSIEEAESLIIVNNAGETDSIVDTSAGEGGDVSVAQAVSMVAVRKSDWAVRARLMSEEKVEPYRINIKEDIAYEVISKAANNTSGSYYKLSDDSSTQLDIQSIDLPIETKSALVEKTEKFNQISNAYVAKTVNFVEEWNNFLMNSKLLDAEFFETLESFKNSEYFEDVEALRSEYSTALAETAELIAQESAMGGMKKSRRKSKAALYGAGSVAGSAMASDEGQNLAGAISTATANLYGNNANSSDDNNASTTAHVFQGNVDEAYEHALTALDEDNTLATGERTVDTSTANNYVLKVADNEIFWTNTSEDVNGTLKIDNKLLQFYAASDAKTQYANKITIDVSGYFEPNEDDYEYVLIPLQDVQSIGSFEETVWVGVNRRIVTGEVPLETEYISDNRPGSPKGSIINMYQLFVARQINKTLRGGDMNPSKYIWTITGVHGTAALNVTKQFETPVLKLDTVVNRLAKLWKYPFKFNGDNEKTVAIISPELFMSVPYSSAKWNNSKIYLYENSKNQGITFLSYNYVQEEDSVYKFMESVGNVKYFDASVGVDSNNEGPSSAAFKTMFICSDYTDAAELKVNDFVHNIAIDNINQVAQKYNVIPGVTRIVAKVFVPVIGQLSNINKYVKSATVSNGTFTYKGKAYSGYNGNVIYDNNFGTCGFYLFTALEPVKLNDNTVTKQYPISSDLVSHSLRFIPMKGLKLTSRHKPGYNENGVIDIEGGIKKIYSVLMEDGMLRGLCNPEMVDYRYIVDSMSYGIESELGGKVYLSELAAKRGKTTAILNMPSKKQFSACINPYFCDSYITGVNVKPAFDTKYIPMGGNAELYSTSAFSLPTEEHGAKFTACFWPNLEYTIRGKKLSIPPAADVANTFIRKHNGGNPYAITANLNGLIINPYVTGVEYDADTKDRDYLEPFGVNTIIRRRGQVMIYGNQTAFQKVKSDFNKLHVREILNYIEIECERILHNYNFAYNTAVLRAAVVTALTPVLQAVQESGAIDSYTIVCDETNNTEEVIAESMGIVDIGVWFNMGMEKIIQRITVNRSFSVNNNE